MSDDVTKAIGARIADRREYLKLSQADVAAKMGKRRAAVSHWETGTNELTVRYLLRLANILRCPPMYILGDVPMSGNEIEEAELIAIYRALPESVRPLLLAAAEGMLKVTETGNTAKGVSSNISN